ncbi:hypothetical protein V2J09_007135 [Rumex salicifolius]
MATFSLVLLLICFQFLTITNLLCFTIAKVDNYIVHMDLEAMPKAFSNHHNWYKSTIDSISTTTNPSSSKLLYTYTHAIQGFSVSLTQSELETLKSSVGYLHSTQESPVVLDTTYTPKFLGLNYRWGAWPSSDYGKDVIIGVIDTGVWPESKSYNDEGFTKMPPSKWKGTCQSGTLFNASLCNNKLIGAQYFNKGLLASKHGLNISMNSVRHGTHTSSTAAGSHVGNASYFGYASGAATGMAPHARLAIYKVLWEEGYSLVDIIAGVDKAISDGVDVISMSLGVDVDSLLDDVIAIATFAAVEKGIFVSLSAGNNGRESLHNGTPWALTVAAGTLDRRLGGTITLGNGVKLDGDSLYQNTTTPNNAPLALMNKCDDFASVKALPNKTVVVCLDADGTAVDDQISMVSALNLASGIFITREAYTDLSLQTSYPAIFLDWKTGKTVTDYINKTGSSVRPPRVSFQLQKTIVGSTVGPKVATYSSRGPSPTCPYVLKPDLMAPGHMILAAWPSSGSPVTFSGAGTAVHNDFNVDSGTSMACPHASGVAALLKGAHPEWSPAMIRSAMMTTADTLDHSGGQIKDLGMNEEAASALAMGAGHINPNKALEPGLVYDADHGSYVDLLCALNYTTKQMKVFTKSSRFDCSTPSIDLNYPSFMFVASGSAKKVFRRHVTNVGAGPATYVVKVTEVDGVEVRVVPEKLVFKEKYEKAGFNVTVTVTGKMTVGKVLDGSLSWVDSEGKYVVKSPILVNVG